MITKEEALTLLEKHVSRKNVLFHMLAVEAVMRETAKYFGEDIEKWGLTGLLHDIDYEKTEATPEKHGLVAETMLKETVSDEILRAIKSHNSQNTLVAPTTRMEKALIACDAISGLLVACALVMPTKKLADVKVETVARKLRDKDFARGADRERIVMCEEIGILRDKFFEVALTGLKAASSKIGL